MKMCPKVILEGTRMTWKTEIAFALNGHPRVVGPRKYRYHSPIISAEWGTFTNDPWGRGLIDFAPHEEAHALETYRTWLRLMELQRYSSWIIDRFHISTMAHQARAGRSVDFRWLEHGLDQLGFRLVFCHRPDDSFAAARERRLKISGNPSQYDDLGVFVDEQAALRALCEASILPTLTLDVADDDPDAAADRIADWLWQTDGIRAREPGV